MWLETVTFKCGWWHFTTVKDESHTNQYKKRQHLIVEVLSTVRTAEFLQESTNLFFRNKILQERDIETHKPMEFLNERCTLNGYTEYVFFVCSNNRFVVVYHAGITGRKHFCRRKKNLYSMWNVRVKSQCHFDVIDPENKSRASSFSQQLEKGN